MARRSRPTRKRTGRKVSPKSQAPPELYQDDGEDERQNVLKNLELLDTPPEERFDRICRQVSEVLGAPASYISFLDRDRQWFKSTVGMGDVKETPRDGTFCDYAIRRSRPTVVLDATRDPLFARSPYVEEGPKVRFYAGVPLTVDGQRVGTLCALDFEPRDDVGEQQLEEFYALAQLAQEELVRGQAAPPEGDRKALITTLSARFETPPDVTAIKDCFHSFSEFVLRWGGRIERVRDIEFIATFIDSFTPEEQATRAAGCAVDIQRVSAFSVGIDQDDAFIVEGLVFGSDTAGRISACASKGQILVSESLMEQLGPAASVRGQLDIQLSGEQSATTLYDLFGVGDFQIDTTGANGNEPDL